MLFHCCALAIFYAQYGYARALQHHVFVHDCAGNTPILDSVISCISNQHPNIMFFSRIFQIIHDFCIVSNDFKDKTIERRFFESFFPIPHWICNHVWVCSSPVIFIVFVSNQYNFSTSRLRHGPPSEHSYRVSTSTNYAAEGCVVCLISLCFCLFFNFFFRIALDENIQYWQLCISTFHKSPHIFPSMFF